MMHVKVKAYLTDPERGFPFWEKPADAGRSLRAGFAERVD